MSRPPGVPPDIAQRVREAVTAALDTKALDLRVLHLAAVTDFTDYFLICSGASDRQVVAIAEAIEERLRGQGVRARHVEGATRGQWVLADFGDFVVHVFLEHARKFYGLDRLWNDAPDVTAEFGA